MEFFLKLYNRQHELKDEIYLFSNLTYTNTLNSAGSMSFNVSANYLKDNNISINLGDHIELYRLYNNVEEVIWYGVVINPTNTDIDTLSVICAGYFALLENRMFKHLWDYAIRTGNMEYLEETYTNVTVGELCLSLLGTTNYYDQTGVTQGKNADYSGVKTTRIIKYDDMLTDKITEFINDGKLYFYINANRELNIYSEYGEDKSNYYVIQDGNILDTSMYVMDYSQIKNQIYGLCQWTEEVENEDGTTDNIERYITYIAEDKESIKNFGLKQYVMSLNELHEQDTLELYCNQELAKLSQPSINITLKVAISDELDIFDIKVGDYIALDSVTLGITQKLRVMEYIVDITTMTVDISLGNTIYRDSEIYQYRY